MWENSPILNTTERIHHPLDIMFDVSINGIDVPDARLAKIFSDGRNASKFTEVAVEFLRDPITLGGNKTVLIYDDSDTSKDARAVIETNSGQLDLPISVRSLTKNGVKFQLSEYMGKGRTCCHSDLIHSLNCYPYFVVVDITIYKKWKMFILQSKDLLECANNHILTSSGWKKIVFYQHLAKWGYCLKNKIAA